ncbi:hypothetical protein QBC39DRAFT_9259 [Podospora conica]|nr:hypothetical protein QBC39DRAFT_9259 [Schizothecium conicum]
MNWLPEVLPPASSAITQIDAIVRGRWVNAESLRRAYRRAANSTTSPSLQDDEVYGGLDRAFRVACMEATMWRSMRPQSGGPSPVVQLGSPRLNYQGFLDLALREHTYLSALFESPESVTVPSSKHVAITLRFEWELQMLKPSQKIGLHTNIWGLAQALRSGYPLMGTIEPHMRGGVFVLYIAFVEMFAGDLRFVSDDEEAAGLLVDACLSLVGAIFQQRDEAQTEDHATGEVVEPNAGPALDNGWFAGVGGMVCRHCGNRDPVGQAGQVEEGVDVGRDDCEVLDEKEARPWGETDVWESATSDEEQELGWTSIFRKKT